MVGFEPVFEFFADELVGGGVVQVPDLDRVEPELFFPGRALCDVVGYTAGGVLLEIPGAVVPQRDMVKVFYIEDVLGDVVGALSDDGICDGVIGEVDDGGVDGDVGGVGSEEIEVVEVGVVFVGAAETDDDE